MKQEPFKSRLKNRELTLVVYAQTAGSAERLLHKTAWREMCFFWQMSTQRKYAETEEQETQHQKIVTSQVWNCSIKRDKGIINNRGIHKTRVNHFMKFDKLMEKQTASASVVVVGFFHARFFPAANCCGHHFGISEWGRGGGLETIFWVVWVVKLCSHQAE